MARPLRVHEIAEQLGICIMTVRREISRGRLPYHKIGKVYVFSQQDVDAYLALIASPARTEA